MYSFKIYILTDFRKSGILYMDYGLKIQKKLCENTLKLRNKTVKMNSLKHLMPCSYEVCLILSEICSTVYKYREVSNN